MIKFQKNNAKILIPIIIFLIGTLCFLYTKFSETSDDTYNINKDFIMYGTNDEQNISSDNNFINNPEKSKIVIHIMGEVIYEGVVEIEEGARIIDARILNTFKQCYLLKPLNMVIFFVKFFIFLLRTFFV